MAIDFPNSPTLMQQFVVGGVTWIWDGHKWTAASVGNVVPEAPNDGQLYGRQSEAWSVVPGGGGGIPDAPNDGTAYARKSAAWAHLTHSDITDWTATLAPYALIASSVASFNARTGSVTLTSSDVTTALTFTPLGDAPNDGQTYGRQSLAWAAIPAAVITADAPADGNGYWRRNGAWQSGGLITTTISIKPASGTAQLACIAGGTTTGAASIQLQKAALGTNRISGLNSSGLSRWQMEFGNNATESGSNTGSDFVVTRYSDAGPSIGVVLSISRATGIARFSGPVDLAVQTVTQSGATLAIDRSLGENCALSLTASITAVTVSNWSAAGTTSKVRLVIANTGAFAISGWPAGTIWPGGVAPTITSGAGKKDIILLMSDDGGTTIYGSIVGQDYR